MERSTRRLREKLTRGWKPRDQSSKHIPIVLQLLPEANGNALNSALEVLRSAAVASKDSKLWVKAVRTSGAVIDPTILGIDGYLEGINAFGFDILQDM